VAIDIGGVEPPVEPCVGHQPIERSAIKKMPADDLGDRTADSALSRAARPVDGDDRRRVGHSVSICSPAERAISTKPGKEVATFATSRISIGPRATRPATAKAM